MRLNMLRVLLIVLAFSFVARPVYANERDPQDAVAAVASEAEKAGAGAAPDAANPQEAKPDARSERAKQEADKAFQREPLVKIRFNQKRVYFERTLEQAVDKAREIKRNVVFDVVSFEPPLNNDANRRVEERSKEAFLRNVMAVVGSLERQGVPGAQINTRSENSDAVPTQEIHVFVR
jgi:hypothetical protein